MNLFVGNLSPETTEQSLRDLFSEFGTIKSVKVIIDPQTGFPKGFGFVEMEDKFQSYEAIDNLDVTYFLGNIISVKEAKGNKTNNNNNRPGGGGSRPFQRRPGGNSSGGSYQRSNSGGYNSNRSYGGGEKHSYGGDQ